MKTSDFPVSFKCNLDWQKMTVVDKGRFCGDCKKVVRDVSGMKEAEAKELLATREGGELCVRYISDRDGRIVFSDSSIVSAVALLRRRSSLMVAASLAVPLALTGCTVGTDSLAEQNTATRDDDYQETMGGMPYEPPDEDAGPADVSTVDADVDAGDQDGGPAEDASVDEDAATDAGPGPGPVTK